jgi:hypothetical protein
MSVYFQHIYLRCVQICAYCSSVSRTLKVPAVPAHASLQHFHQVRSVEPAISACHASLRCTYRKHVRCFFCSCSNFLLRMLTVMMMCPVQVLGVILLRIRPRRL